MKKILFVLTFLISFCGLAWGGDGDTATPNTDMTYNTGMTNNNIQWRTDMTTNTDMTNNNIQWRTDMTTNTGMTNNTSDPRTGMTDHSEIPDVPAAPNPATPNVDIDVFNR